MTGRFVQVRPRAFEDAVLKHELSLAEQGVLSRLLLLVDYRTARYDCTLDELAERLGIHRHNLRPKLARLAECGLIERSFPKGHRGSVVMTSYLDLVHLPASQVANHALRMERFPAMRDDGPDDPQVAKRAVTSSDLRRANRTRLSMSVDAPARGEVAPVVDLAKARSRVTSHSPTNATSDRAPTPTRTADETTTALGASMRHVGTHVGRDTAGGGSEATPVHPRSRIDVVTPSLRTEAPLRDPRAMGGAS